MVGALDVAKDVSFFQVWEQMFAHQKVVYTPAAVALTASHHIAPPGIGFLLIGIEVAEGVYESAVEQLGEHVALLVGRSGQTSHTTTGFLLSRALI